MSGRRRCGRVGGLRPTWSLLRCVAVVLLFVTAAPGRPPTHVAAGDRSVPTGVGSFDHGGRASFVEPADHPSSIGRGRAARTKPTLEALLVVLVAAPTVTTAAAKRARRPRRLAPLRHGFGTGTVAGRAPPRTATPSSAA